MSFFVLPEQNIEIDLLGNESTSSFSIKQDFPGDNLKNLNNWEITAPAEKGLYRIEINRKAYPDTMRLNIFVMIPYSEKKSEYLYGYRIGNYPTVALKDLEIYKPPKGFVEITESIEDEFLSPHFKVKQFVSIQQNSYPKYIVLREKLILKLELILEKMNEQGYSCNTFSVMSGYRTPYYNKLIGNVKYSRHIYGGAADIFIDLDPVDNMMDDLNKDGQINWKDANILYTVIDNLYGKKFYTPFIGGLGLYKKNPNHGPFVHVDVRGFRARWD